MELKNDILKLLGIFISVKEPNLRYLGLETMCKFALISVEQIEDHINTIFKSLRDNDISIRKRALELLYLMSTPSTSVRIVEEMLSYAEQGADLQIKDDLILKIAILAEKFADNLYWYVDVIVRMINSSGDFVTEDIWFRIVQIIIGFTKEPNTELQRYAAQKIYQSLSVPHVHETLVCIGAFVISEYSHFLVEQGKDPQKIFDILNKHYQYSSEKGRQMLLNAFVKLGSKYEELRD
jgi:AP-2 complex subunit alpha